MSKVKRILSVIMAMVMVLAMSVPTFAAGENATITLKRFDNGSRFLSCLVYPGSACFTGFLGHQSFCLVL